ncbi:MAG: septal ring lytic transglycosylase RlpA family protein [Novosphingobium sp.]|nr:septal ring lytic transglycosylase RlpA family protein [Novosphingobium sp.]
MFNRNGRKATQQRRLAFIAGTAFAVSAIAISATAEAPARADERVPQPAFEQAFAPFELTDAEAQPSADAIAAAEARFAEAPVEEAAPEPEQFGDASPIGSGRASYYGAGFAGRPTANGERFNPAGLTAAHRTLPFGTRVKVTNASNGRSVVVRINDRGPFHGGRVIDLSQEAARQIGLIQQGSGLVQLATVS